METIWECMNIASRITKQIDASDALVPKASQGTCKPSTDLQELSTTVTAARTSLVPFVANSKKSKAVSDPAFDTCISGMKETLAELHSYFKDLEKDFSPVTWKTQKVKIYQIDFLIKQKLDQFVILFNSEEATASKDTSTKKPKDLKASASVPVALVHSLITDPEGKEFWMKTFGETTNIVPWSVFFPKFELSMNTTLKDDEEWIKAQINFTKTDHVSVYEFSVFLKWFAPYKGSVLRMLEAIHGGLLCGFVPAIEANLLLEGKKEGSYLIRCSKTQPGSFAVTFVDSSGKVKHCLLYSVATGLTLKNPPTIYASLKEFTEGHNNKLKYPFGNKYTLTKKLKDFAYDGKISALDDPSSSSSSSGATSGMGGSLPSHSEGNQCIVCMDAPLQCVFLECGHFACCLNCSEKLKMCPICRNPIVRVVPIYRV